jgi:hypothetical protein
MKKMELFPKSETKFFSVDGVEATFTKNETGETDLAVRLFGRNWKAKKVK